MGSLQNLSVICFLLCAVYLCSDVSGYGYYPHHGRYNRTIYPQRNHTWGVHGYGYNRTHRISHKRSVATLPFHPEFFNLKSGPPHDFVIGQVGRGDVQMYTQFVKKSKSWNPWGKVTANLTYPGNKRAVLTCIQALDKSLNGNGGYASITKGGIGWQNVTMGFASQAGKEINFLVYIYGHYY